MSVQAATFNRTGDDAIVAWATDDVRILVINEAGDPFDLSSFDAVQADYRLDNVDGSVVFNCANAATTNFPDTGATIELPKTAGSIRLVIGADDTGDMQTNDQEAGGVWDCFVYTAATGAGNTEQYKVVKGTWTGEASVTRVTP